MSHPPTTSLNWGDIDEQTDVTTVLSALTGQTGKTEQKAEEQKQVEKPTTVTSPITTPPASVSSNSPPGGAPTTLSPPEPTHQLNIPDKATTTTTAATVTSPSPPPPSTVTQAATKPTSTSSSTTTTTPTTVTPTTANNVEEKKSDTVPATTAESKTNSQSSESDVSSVTSALATTTVSPAAAADTEDNNDDDAVLPASGLHPNDKTAEVEILNSTNIYRAAESFESLNIPENLLRGVYDMKFSSPSKIQARALPIILDAQNRPNLIGQAQHGSGKTAAFCLGILCQIDVTSNTCQAMVVTPTRELAIQITDVAKSLAKYTEIKIQCVVPQITLPDGPILSHVVVGTPGSLKNKLDKRTLNSRTIRIFVADEADQMVSVEEGLGDQTIAIKNKLGKQCQILLFSATFDGKTSDFAKRVAPNAVEIRIKTEELSLDGIKQFYVEVQNSADKYKALSSIFSLLEIGASIIFVQTVATAKWLANQMRTDGYTVSLLHGKDMAPDERDKVMNDFRAGKTNVLITTNVLSRGIDVLSVTLVINYDIPTTRHMRADTSTYIHRIGRSGRFGRKGVAINFVHDAMSKRLLSDITAHFGKQLDIDMVQLPYNDLEKSSQIVQKALGK